MTALEWHQAAEQPPDEFFVWRPVKSFDSGGTLRIFGPAILFVAMHAAFAQDERLPDEEALKIPLWSHMAEVRGSFGYKDNVLLSHTNSAGSAFWMSGAELIVFRLPSHGWQFHFFADASDVRYFDAKPVTDEQMAIAAAQLGKDFGGGWKSTLGVNYLFQNQVFDFSGVYTNRATIGQIVGHTLAPRWGLRKTVGAFWLEGEVNATRQWLDAPLDDYWRFGPRAAAGHRWEPGSELSLAYQYSRLDYDTREQVDRQGAPLASTSLALNSHLVELSLTQLWDQKRRWQTVTSAGYEANLDNGSGFFDYDHFRLSQLVRYRDENWEISARARAGHFEYSIQTVSALDAAHRRKTMLSVSVRAERKLTKHLKAHAGYIWDRSISNLDFDDYQANTVLAGMSATF
jgi:hypothetical protein